MTQTSDNTNTSIVNPVADKSLNDLIFWKDTLFNIYGIDGHLELLDGEYDLNIAVEVDSAKWGVLKIMRPDCEVDFVDMQCRAISHAQKANDQLALPVIFKSLEGDEYQMTKGPTGEDQLIWVVRWLNGDLYGNVKPQLLPTIRNIGEQLGLLDKALAGFDHAHIDRELKWDLQQANWIKGYLNQFSNLDEKAQITSIQSNFENYILPKLSELPKVAIHNDLNDYNLMVSHKSVGEFDVSGMIDFGDMVKAPRVCEIAIAGAYIVLGQSNPVAALSAMIKGYHGVHPLRETELALIYPLLLTRLAVSVTNSAIIKKERPDDAYVVISEAPAWTFLKKAREIDAQFMLASIRLACGLAALPQSDTIRNWLDEKRGSFHPMLDADLKQAVSLDLSPEGSTIPANPLKLEAEEWSDALEDLSKKSDVIIGRYCEPRLMYTAPEFRSASHHASDKRTIHMGTDIFVPAGSIVYASCDAMVHAVDIFTDHLDYGGVIVLRYQIEDNINLYALFGHLAHEVSSTWKVGDKVDAGQQIAKIGDFDENGGWTPHLHYQLALSDFGKGCDIDGVVNADDLEIWQSYFPNPAAMFNLEDEEIASPLLDHEALIEARKNLYSPNLKLSYKKPIPMIRGWKHFLFDDMGRTYLDAYNNVPHVGHAHPRIQKVAATQLKKINTNTRYLHPEQAAYAKKLTSWMPEELDCVFFLNSATEANELAIRIARQVTGQKDTVVMATGYHGHTNVALALSEYKFNGPGGKGPEDWIHIVPVADVYRGVIREDHPAPGPAYAKYVEDTVKEIENSGKKTAAFICETYPSVGGQIVLPDGYLEATYRAIRGSGGLCIADETQTGLGRIGSHKFGFETQNVVPDMVVLGKPIGNGHPLGALVTTRKIAEEFSNGMEFFSTFGGSTLSCVVGHELLKIMEDEAVQKNSHQVGSYLIDGLWKLAEKHQVIGDVRGAGLFIGVDLVTNRESRDPATEIANYVLNRLQQQRILIGTDGPHDNVLKIRPPLTFGIDDADYLLSALEEILQENPCQI